jgi:hypothetical protein
MPFQYILTDRSITIVIDGIPHHVPRPDDLDTGRSVWDAVKNALNDPSTTTDQMLGIINPSIGVDNATKDIDGIRIYNGSLYYNGNIVHSALADRIVDIVREGLPVVPWVRFAGNVYSNPAEFSREELYLFLEKADLPITEDGCFLAYKNVRDDYKDIYSGSISNTIGSIVSMPRQAVDVDRYRTCSTGLHFASKDYLPHYRSGGSRTVVVKINPADVVSIPSDYDNTKGRCWRYEVVGEIPFEQIQTYVWPSIIDDDWLDDDDWWNEEDEDWQDEDFADLNDDTNENDDTPNTYLDAIANPSKGFIKWIRRLK